MPPYGQTVCPYGRTNRPADLSSQSPIAAAKAGRRQREKVGQLSPWAQASWIGDSIGHPHSGALLTRRRRHPMRNDGSDSRQPIYVHGVLKPRKRHPVN